MPTPTTAEYGAFFSRYVSHPTGNDARIILEESLTPLNDFLNSLPREKAGYAYAPGKWTLRQLLQHMIDTERVFAYRAMAISRGETQWLPGFDENLFAENAAAEQRTLEDLSAEFILVRESTILLYKHMSEEGLMRMGTASNHPINANALAFITVGHVMHHQAIIAERYL